jgi:hypothetical protein
MSLATDLENLICRIDEVIKEIDDTMKGKNNRNMSDIRYSAYFFDELERAFSIVNEELDIVNERMYWTDPTPRLDSLRSELVRKYDRMYEIYNHLADFVKEKMFDI